MIHVEFLHSKGGLRIIVSLDISIDYKCLGLSINILLSLFSMEVLV
jgi:hypothetical protein